MKLDIGCGGHKRHDYLGIDTAAYPGIDWVGDLNGMLPFSSHAVDEIAVCRMLAYAADLTRSLSELYRISKHGAVVTLLCPYAHHFRHSSNPYLKHRFDEYTPRYLTANFLQPENGPVCPPIKPYDNFPPLPFDFRLLHMELFYDSAFSPPLYDQDELELLKSLQANVVDEILYRFVVAKEELPFETWQALCLREHSEPRAVLQLRERTRLSSD